MSDRIAIAQPAILDWVQGDASGLAIPAHAAALREGGVRFLTAAFHAAGALAPDNRVSAITRFEELFAGGTGRKLLLSVAYEKQQPGLPAELFVKFSRDFDDEIRDRARHMMETEIRLARLSRAPGFPIAVPQCLFADYHAASGSGILITERVAFGTGCIEPHYPKCLDYEMPEPAAHYRAILKAIARLAGAHKAGRLPDVAGQLFPFDKDRLIAMDRFPYSAARLQNRVSRYAEFAAAFAHLLPANIASADFIAKLMDETARFSEHEVAIRDYLHSKPDFIALCHWNANIDNAWFWRNEQGELACGLLDWARAGQMNVAAALYGALSGAEAELWDDHLDALLALFATEYRDSGGPCLDIPELKLHVQLFTALMGLAYIMDAPPIIRMQLPDLARTTSRFDAQFRNDETARVQLHMLTMFLNQWQTQDFGAALARVLERRRVHASER